MLFNCNSINKLVCFMLLILIYTYIYLFLILVHSLFVLLLTAVCVCVCVRRMHVIVTLRRTLLVVLFLVEVWFAPLHLHMTEGQCDWQWHLTEHDVRWAPPCPHCPPLPLTLWLSSLLVSFILFSLLYNTNSFDGRNNRQVFVSFVYCFFYN